MPSHVKKNDGKLTISNIEFRATSARIRQYLVDAAAPVGWGDSGGHKFMGQSFTSPHNAVITKIRLNTLFVKLPKDEAPTKPLVLHLRDSPSSKVDLAKAIVSTSRSSRAGGFVIFDIPEIPVAKDGKYYFFLDSSEPENNWACRYKNSNVYKGGELYINGKKQTNADLTFEIEYLYPGPICFTGNWNLFLDGNKLKSEFTLTATKEMEFGGIGYHLETPWIKDGYDVVDNKKILFSRFYNSHGEYMPIEQFKRHSVEKHSCLCLYSKWLYATGTNDYDLRFSDFGQRIHWTMNPDMMTFRFYTRPKGSRHYREAPFEYEYKKRNAEDLISKNLMIEVLPHTEKIPSYFPVFFSSDPKMDELLNRFYYERAFWYGGGLGVYAQEWVALTLAWVNTPIRDYYKLMFLPGGDGFYWYKVGEDGYVWSQGNFGREYVPPWHGPHFTTNAQYILSFYRLYTWTGDRSFLFSAIENLRKVMRYQLEEWGGAKGLIINKEVDGVKKIDCTNYFDLLPFSYKDAYANIYFYASLKAMSELEREMGNLRQAEYLENLRPVVKKAYNNTFWDEKKGRYIGCIDASGRRHDYGFTFLNLEAMCYGLASQEQAKRIYQWMQKGDTYTKWEFAPRTNTIPNKKWFEPLFVKAGRVRQHPYGTMTQNGGAFLWTSGYDIIDRARFLGADNAYQRFSEMLDRYNKPDKLCGGNPLYYGETVENVYRMDELGSVGVDDPFPESGLAPASFLYAFIGIKADIEGLKIKPNLPQGLKYAGVKNLNYWDMNLDITVTKNLVNIKCSENNTDYNFYVVDGWKKIENDNLFTIKKTIVPGEIVTLEKMPLRINCEGHGPVEVKITKWNPGKTIEFTSKGEGNIVYTLDESMVKGKDMWDKYRVLVDDRFYPYQMDEFTLTFSISHSKGKECRVCIRGNS